MMMKKIPPYVDFEKQTPIGKEDGAKVVESLEMALVRVSTLLEVTSSSDKNNIYPHFLLRKGDYVLLYDIQCLFNNQEDYALMLLSHVAREHHSILDDSDVLKICDMENNDGFTY